MEVTITWQTVITVSSVLAAVIAIGKTYNKTYDWVKHQQEQDKELKELKSTLEKELGSIREEQGLLTYAVLSCLKGLKEQGCNGPVTEAIDKVDKYLNQTAHKGGNL